MRHGTLQAIGATAPQPTSTTASRPAKRQRASHHGGPTDFTPQTGSQLAFPLSGSGLGTCTFASIVPWIPQDDSSLDNHLYRGADPAIVGDHSSTWNYDALAQLGRHTTPKPLLPRDAAFHLDYLGLDCSDASITLPHDVTARRAMSIISSSTICSPGSIVSQPSSAGSSLSPVQTEIPSDWLTTASTYSRGPSPLHQVDSIAEKQTEFLCLGPQCDQAFTTDEGLKAHIKAVHTHTCNWAGCDQPSFSTRDGLIWHVKFEHLLVCPVPTCTETSFKSQRFLECHLRNAHREHQGKEAASYTSETPKPTLTKVLPVSTASENTLKTSCSQKDVMKDRAIQEMLSVDRSKRRCREQLRAVVERKAKKAAAAISRGADSPSDLVRGKLPRQVENASFPLVWEHGVLPFLVEFVPKWCGPGHVISVTRGRAPGSRRVCFMTKKKLSRARRVIIAAHVNDLLPSNHKQHTSFSFSNGEVSRLVWARGLSRGQPDEICQARNPFFFKDPCMGDSIGIPGNDAFSDSTATLGPCIVVGGQAFWLANLHPFMDAYQNIDRVDVEHPSPGDRLMCMEEQHDALLDETDFRLGTISAASGIHLKTTRVSHDPYWEESDKEPPLIVTDWSLITAQSRQANILRRFPLETMPPVLKETPIKATGAIVPGAPVVSTGRTSGYQRGQICDIPAYVSGDHDGNSTGRATREWFVEEPEPYDDEEAWIRGGIGVEGDSGAVIIDPETNTIIGQLWGRNKYFGPGPRHTFFTPIADIFDDIQEKSGLEQGRPQLPQYRDEARSYPMYPTCRQCYDLRTYLDSRRSSRASMLSMIGNNESDPDLTSIEAMSELATPKDQSHWLRHTGIEEAGSSFNTGLSPLASFSFHHNPGTPGVVDVKSPYAQTLSADDLYDGECDPRLEANIGKRSAPGFPMIRTSSHGAVKRPRIN